jgi:hypothetical protein
LLSPPPLLVPTEVLEAITRAAPEHANTLMGTSLRVFGLLRKSLELLRMARARRATDFGDESLADLVNEARALERSLEDEKTRYAGLVNRMSTTPSGQHLVYTTHTTERPATYLSWQYMHEGYRVATLLVLQAFVLETPPYATQVRLLVRQALSLLETMYEQNLPGFCSAHFVIFTAGLCSASGGANRQDRMDDRQRVERLYENTLYVYHFSTAPRPCTPCFSASGLTH